jgi:hypothetical protein
LLHTHAVAVANIGQQPSAVLRLQTPRRHAAQRQGQGLLAQVAVAGLGVAIPALFGYNYLLTRIKSVSADMNVFVDDFVARMAEAYGG